MRLRAFPERVGPRILLLESVDYFRKSEHFSGRKKRKINQQNFDGEANWFGCSTSSPGLFSQKMSGAGKGPGIGWSRVQPKYS